MTELTPNEVETLRQTPPLKAFSELTLAFCQTLSDTLLNDPRFKVLPDLVALGFWTRRANIERMVQENSSALLKPLGLVVHYTPANVDTMFVYSWLCSLLMGNTNLVRLSSRESEVRTLLMQALSCVMQTPDFESIRRGNRFVRFDKHSDLAKTVSRVADARVIWGGDQTVAEIRALPSAPRCRDISFADRYSAALINGDSVQSRSDITKVAQMLWRDTEAYAQQACSSPRVVFWLGDQTACADVFAQVSSEASAQAPLLNQRTQHVFVRQLMQSTGCAGRPFIDDQICVLPVSDISPDMLDWHQGAGFYLLRFLDNLADLQPYLADKLQTLTYSGLPKEALLKLIDDPSIKGVDRIVPLGSALNFSPVWDGHPLLRVLSRTIEVL